MRNATTYAIILVIGIIALIFGILNQVQALGYHPTRAIAGIAVGIILIIAGVAGMVAIRNRSRL